MVIAEGLRSANVPCSALSRLAANLACSTADFLCQEDQHFLRVIAGLCIKTQRAVVFSDLLHTQLRPALVIGFILQNLAEGVNDIKPSLPALKLYILKKFVIGLVHINSELMGWLLIHESFSLIRQLFLYLHRLIFVFLPSLTYSFQCVQRLYPADLSACEVQRSACE